MDEPFVRLPHLRLFGTSHSVTGDDKPNTNVSLDIDGQWIKFDAKAPM